MQFEQASEFILNKLSNELPEQLCYHSIAHVKDVYAAADSIAKQEGISDYERKLLLTAACYHDAGFLKGAQNHEEESCRLVREVLPGYEYAPEDIERICGMIRATKIPQRPTNLLEEILADADLDYLGRDDFYTVGEMLFKELINYGIVDNAADWNHLQVIFLESHHYFTSTAIRLRQAKKEAHLAGVKAKIE